MGPIVQTIYEFVLYLWTQTFPRLDWVVIIFIELLSWTTAAHALLNKRDSRAALGWVAVCIMFPPLGPLFYFLFGINRVRTQGQRLGGPLTAFLRISVEEDKEGRTRCIPISSVPESFRPIAGLSDRVTHLPLTPGNRIEPLENGEEAYPAMLEAIAQARQKIFLSTYIMDTDNSGRRFVAALAEAVQRGVDVRVILDGVGEYYSLRRAGTLMRRNHVPVKKFLPPKLLPPSLYINLRTHRKILTIDGQVGFTGGMNIGDRHLTADQTSPGRVKDIHFRIRGPVVAQMEQVFLADWSFCNKSAPPPQLESCGDKHMLHGEALCRTVVDGPNEDIDKLAMILMGATAVARRRIFIMTPYFLPSRDLVGALQTAALRGVDVRILLPAKNNLPYVKWASDNMLWMLLKEGVRIFYQPPPFVHTKLFLIDDYYAIIGSANIDPRSLRLNFEMVLEVYDPKLNHDLAERFTQAMAASRETSLAEMDGRPLPVKVRDSLCWLFTPYL
ncbi:MAG: cardiolipin synthase [Desulfobacteraceae bacterium]|nr:cardiolipin synthase [Desulfobacteraceae bacterium]